MNKTNIAALFGMTIGIAVFALLPTEEKLASEAAHVIKMEVKPFDLPVPQYDVKGRLIISAKSDKEWIKLILANGGKMCIGGTNG